MPEIGVDGTQYSFPLVVTHELLSEGCCLLSWEAVLQDECEVCPALAKASSACSCIGDVLDLNDGVAWLRLGGLLVVKITRWARRAGVIEELFAALVGSFCLPLSLLSKLGMAS